MITGDNAHTAKAIANQSGILTANGIVLEGRVMRSMTPREFDEALPALQVVARASANDKYLIVARTNGYNLPKNEREWLDYHDPDGSKRLSWMEHRDLLLPGYLEEWERVHPNRRDVVGVTGDGTNDAPALTAADVGIGMGFCGTKVAQLASDIIILDDKFSSIVNAIVWGRCVYDNIRKFLQFQLTVSLVTLLLFLVGLLSGIGSPLNSIMMLWANLIMDSCGALALATEYPSPDLLKRKPYKRSANLVCMPMLRNIGIQVMYQLTILFWVLYRPKALFGTAFCAFGECETCSLKSDPSDALWNPATGQKDSNGTIGCNTFEETCGTGENWSCYEDSFQNLDGYLDDCLTCTELNRTHSTIIFNIFVFCQMFNEFNCRKLFNDYHVLKGINRNPIFWVVIAITVACQVLFVEFGGNAFQTSGLSSSQWLITIALGFGTIPIGFLMRFIPVVEDPHSFNDSSDCLPGEFVVSENEFRAHISSLRKSLSTRW